ncbi:MAG: tetratricopeptide repeat protein, partial [Phycisphaerales bacterium]|nr:tetratricopeptide repeat protein [Phycisphaerales bacterium]
VRRHPAKFTIGVLLVVMVGGGIAWYAQVRAEITRNANRRIEEAFNDLAYENYRDGDRAREKIAEAAPEFSDQALYWKTFGLSRVIENPKEAEKDLRKALELRPDDVECMYLLAWTLRRLEQPDKCEALIREADKALDSDSATWAQTPTVHFFRATAIVRSQPEKAEESYEKAIATYSLMSKGGAYYQARLHLGRAKNNAQYHTRSAEDFTAIEKNLSMACTLHPEQAYPHYLLSLAYRINAEIYLAQGDVDRARRRFATALAHAENAVDAEPRSPRGYAARAEFWESVSDRCDELGRLRDDAERKAFHESHAQNEHSDGMGACEFCDWLGTPQDEALRRAVAERSIALPGLNDKDELEFYEYRWLDHYWLGDLVAAGDDLGKVAELTPETHQKWIWYTRLAPLLIDAERQGVDVAGEALNSLTNALAESKDFRVCTSIACLHHLFGRADLASAFLADRRGAVEFGEGDMAAWEILANTEGAPGGDREVPRNARACSLFFRGVVALGAGDREAAGAWLVACEECYDYEDYGYLARMLRRRMDSDPAWPNWAPQNTDVGN